MTKAIPNGSMVYSQRIAVLARNQGRRYWCARSYLAGAAATHVPCVQFPLWQSRLRLHTPPSAHWLPQSPPHRLLMSLGVQHLPLAQAKLLQSSLVVQPCPSRHRLAQLPLQAGPQQRPPLQTPLWQSVLLRQMAASAHLAPQVPPHWLVASLGAQHFACTQPKLRQSLPVEQPCPLRQLLAQFPLQAGPQQRWPEHAPLWQSPLAAQTLASGHCTPHLPPQRLAKSLGLQHVPLIQAASLPQSLSAVQVCAAGHGTASRPRTSTAAATITGVRTSARDVRLAIRKRQYPRLDVIRFPRLECRSISAWQIGCEF